MATKLKIKKLLLVLPFIFTFYFMLLLCISCTSGYKTPDKYSAKQVTLFPDYNGVTFPKNIAPANFSISIKAEEYQTIIRCSGKEYFKQVSSSPQVKINYDSWKRMLEENPNKSFNIIIGVKNNNRWTEYKAITNHISTDTIDTYLVYRLIYPGYELWNNMGIYQRNLTNFKETPILENKNFGKQCVNCHTFNKQSPKTMMLHVRGKNGGTLIYNGKNIVKVKPNCKGIKMGATYAAWHPSAQFIAFSMNEIQQFFHSSGKKAIEVTDLAADIAIYDVKNNNCFTAPYLKTKQIETFPTWSPNGKHLFYCRGNEYKPGTPIDSIRYDLYCVNFNSKDKSFSKPKCIYAASAKKKSVSFPKISPDGNFVLLTESNYGNFSIWHTEADLVLINLKTNKLRRVTELNSTDVESFHTWSSTGKWIVFSSKRIDGGWTRPFFAHFNKITGTFSKPFVLPQSNPLFYQTFMKSYNLPELITSPIINKKELLNAIGYK